MPLSSRAWSENGRQSQPFASLYLTRAACNQLGPPPGSRSNSLWTTPTVINSLKPAT